MISTFKALSCPQLGHGMKPLIRASGRIWLRSMAAPQDLQVCTAINIGVLHWCGAQERK